MSTDKTLGGDEELAGVLAVRFLTLRMAIVDAVDLRPLRPRVVVSAAGRRLREQLEVHH
jgi:hypothetical protein